ncbi:MAG: helix-turn-helix transcriptional regulator [Chloroflexota bacterium]|nr:helix-turn-helix transcriptional regulator [Chloroflexota bacterium]
MTVVDIQPPAGPVERLRKRAETLHATATAAKAWRDAKTEMVKHAAAARAAGVTWRDLAAATGVSITTLADWIEKAAIPSLPQLGGRNEGKGGRHA